MAILSFPLLDIEYSKRFGLLLFIAQSMLLLMLFKFITVKTEHILAVLVAFITLASIVLTTAIPKAPAMKYRSIYCFKNSKTRLKTLRILVARHGLEWWAAWPLHTKIAQDKVVNRECFQNIRI